MVGRGEVMAEVLVLVEHAEGAVKKVTGELLTAARALGEPAAVVVGAPDVVAALADPLAEFGAAKIYAVDDAATVEVCERELVAPKAALLAQLVAEKSPAAVVIAATTEGREVAGRLAVRLESGLLADVTEVRPDGTATQVIFAGGVVSHTQVAMGTPIFAVRPSAVAAVPSPSTPVRESVAVSLDSAGAAATILERVTQAKSSRPELTEASVVVSGGRGVGSAENFAVIEAFADALGGAVGASRAATDSGYYPHQFQVGQTGKTVSPQLYVAAGISGAIQHRAGMQTSKVIVAVNKDAEAPIFELADFGVVGDLFNVLPQATEEVLKRKG
jgi:electron transfer flavoprotein alpha subunit